jgi:hypothetical protein
MTEEQKKKLKEKRNKESKIFEKFMKQWTIYN